MVTRTIMIFALASFIICAVAFAVTRSARSTPTPVAATSPASTQQAEPQLERPPLADFRSRLALNAEAFRQSKRLGKRYRAGGQSFSFLTGQVTIGGSKFPVRIRRTPDETGEQVSIDMPGRGQSGYSWRGDEGASAASGSLSSEDKLLIERLVMDSPDQFVLAQVRGASYATVARMVRADDAEFSEDYKGPLWDIIRVDDPESDEQKVPLSRWRLYYINVETGRIDKVVSEAHGDRIEANFSGWTEEGGETFPSRITWMRQGQPVMELAVNTLTFTSHQ